MGRVLPFAPLYNYAAVHEARNGHFRTFTHVICSPESRHSTVIGGTTDYWGSQKAVVPA